MSEEMTIQREDLPGVPDRSTMTVEEFTEREFVPRHVSAKSIAGRVHYRAILKHLMVPETVERIFRDPRAGSLGRLKEIPNWPYIGHLRLCDVGPADVGLLLKAALDRGYSPQTAKHIRSVTGAIFTHARKRLCYSGENPAMQTPLPRMRRKQTSPLTLDETKALLNAMRYPEKEIAIMVLYTGMSVAEICGLQWRFVNLADSERIIDGKRLPPRTIAVREQWCRGELEPVSWKSRRRNLPIPGPLLKMLADLPGRPVAGEPQGFVLASRNGAAVNGHVARRRLKALGERIEFAELSWRVLLRTRAGLLAEYGHQFQSLLALPSSDQAVVAGAKVAPKDVPTWTGAFWMSLGNALQYSAGTWSANRLS
jgi:integrase